jgi:hypothetical protein
MSGSKGTMWGSDLDPEQMTIWKAQNKKQARKHLIIRSFMLFGIIIFFSCCTAILLKAMECSNPCCKVC